MLQIVAWQTGISIALLHDAIWNTYGTQNDTHVEQKILWTLSASKYTIGSAVMCGDVHTPELSSSEYKLGDPFSIKYLRRGSRRLHSKSGSMDCERH